MNGLTLDLMLQSIGLSTIFNISQIFLFINYSTVPVKKGGIRNEYLRLYYLERIIILLYYSVLSYPSL